jgi:hypothetical protein
MVLAKIIFAIGLGLIYQIWIQIHILYMAYVGGTLVVIKHFI